MIFDAEEEFHPSEVRKIYKDVLTSGLSLIVFAEWYNTSVMREAKFYDDNTRRWWTPVTGGANVPALNSIILMKTLFKNSIYTQYMVQIFIHSFIYQLIEIF